MNQPRYEITVYFRAWDRDDVIVMEEYNVPARTTLKERIRNKAMSNTAYVVRYEVRDIQTKKLIETVVLDKNWIDE